MNLSKNPSKAELKELLASCADEVSDHLLWVSNDGGVHLVPIEPPMTPAKYVAHVKQEFRFRLETYQKGNGYVGAKASEDEAYVADLFDELNEAWVKGKTGYVDY